MIALGSLREYQPFQDTITYMNSVHARQIAINKNHVLLIEVVFF
jgi:hypothetical protein